MKQAILNLGLYLTWSPRIHEFASLDDQQKILSMYLSSILDPGSAFFGLPIELFRKILEENFFLGKKHKQCDECVQNRGNEFHGLVGSKYLLSCCLYECRCFNNYIYEKNELCMGKNPMRELWGMGVGMWKDVDDEYHDTSKYRELI